MWDDGWGGGGSVCTEKMVQFGFGGFKVALFVVVFFCPFRRNLFLMSFFLLFLFFYYYFGAGLGFVIAGWSLFFLFFVFLGGVA